MRQGETRVPGDPYRSGRRGFFSWSSEILAQAGWLALTCGAKLYVVNCISSREVDWVKTHYASEDDFVASGFISGEKERRQSLLAGVAQGAGLDEIAGLETVVAVGSPFEQIMAAVEDLSADLLVLGPRGRNLSTRFALGSTIEKIFRHCPVPVLRLGPEINSIKEVAK